MICSKPIWVLLILLTVKICKCSDFEPSEDRLLGTTTNGTLDFSIIKNVLVRLPIFLAKSTTYLISGIKILKNYSSLGWANLEKYLNYTIHSTGIISKDIRHAAKTLNKMRKKEAVLNSIAHSPMHTPIIVTSTTGKPINISREKIDMSTTKKHRKLRKHRKNKHSKPRIIHVHHHHHYPAKPKGLESMSIKPIIMNSTIKPAVQELLFNDKNRTREVDGTSSKPIIKADNLSIIPTMMYDTVKPETVINESVTNPKRSHRHKRKYRHRDRLRDDVKPNEADELAAEKLSSALSNLDLSSTENPSLEASTTIAPTTSKNQGRIHRSRRRRPHVIHHHHYNDDANLNKAKEFAAEKPPNTSSNLEESTETTADANPEAPPI